MDRSGQRARRLALWLAVLVTIPGAPLAAGEERAPPCRRARILVVRADPDVRRMAPPEGETAPRAEVFLDAPGVAAADDEGPAPQAAPTPAPTLREEPPAAAAPLPEEEEVFPEYRIRTGDILEISIPYEPETTKTVPVRPDGRINYLFDIEVIAAGRTYRELNRLLRGLHPRTGEPLPGDRNLAKYYKEPRVTIIGRSFGGNSVFVMGPVADPGRHTIQNDTRLLDVLSVAGAMSVLPQASGDLDRQEEVLDLSEAYVAREYRDPETGRRQMKVLEEVDFGQLLLGQNLEHNIALRPRDFIFLPSSLSTEKEIFVLGQVVEPGRYRFLRTTTFLGAVAQAEGTLRSGAWERRCLVIRGGLKGDQEIIPVNLPAIVAGEEEDFPLENGDIVYVPKTPLFKTAEIIESVLLPLRKILEVDDMGKNQFREGHRQWEDIISSRALGGG